MATLAELTQSPLPAKMAEDSESFLAVLRGKQTSARQYLISQSIQGYFAIRDGAWKLIIGGGSGGWSDPKPGSKEEKALPVVQLYNLAQDPGEKENLQDRYPERVQQMKALLEKMVVEGRSTPGELLKNDVPVQVVKKPSKKKLEDQ